MTPVRVLTLIVLLPLAGAAPAFTLAAIQAKAVGVADGETYVSSRAQRPAGSSWCPPSPPAPGR